MTTTVGLQPFEVEVPLESSYVVDLAAPVLDIGNGFIPPEVLVRASDFSGRGVFSVLMKPIALVAAPFSSVGTLSAVVRADGGTKLVSPEFSGAGTLAATGIPRFVRTVSLTGAGVLTAKSYVRVAGRFSGAGTLSTTARFTAPVSAAFEGRGDFLVDTWADGGMQFTNAPFSGAGALTAQAFAKYVRTATFSGVGTLSATRVEREIVAPQFVGDGVLTAAAQVWVRAALSGAGTLSATSFERERVTAAFSGAGVLSATAVGRTTVEMGLNKASTQRVTRSTWTKFVDWTVRPGFPQTELANDSLTVRGTGLYRVVFVDARTESNATSNSRVLVNGVPLDIAPVVAGAVLTIDTVLNLTNGDVLSFEGYNTSASASGATTSTNSYVELTKADPKPIRAMAMTKDSSSYTAPTSSVWGNPTGWVAKADYPGTNLVGGNTLVINETGPVTVTAKVTFAASATGNAVRILVDGVEVAVSPNGGVSQTVSIAGTVNAGQVVTMEVKSNGGSSTRVVTSDTSLTIDV